MPTSAKCNKPPPSRLRQSVSPSSLLFRSVSANSTAKAVAHHQKSGPRRGPRQKSANGSGQLAKPAGVDRSTPSRIEGLGEPAVGVAILDDAICALLRSGVVACWGDNLLGQLGRGTRDLELHYEPVRVVIP